MGRLKSTKKRDASLPVVVRVVIESAKLAYQQKTE
jgi:hypothetical protein